MESFKIGESYKVIELEKYGGNLTLKTKQFRELDNEEILVKVMCATMHPADLSFIRGQYGLEKPTPPLVPGLEASGIIIEVGKDGDRSLIGKRCGIVAYNGKHGYNGVWSQYAYQTRQGVLVFDGEIDYETICFAQGNPLTACGFVDTLKKKGVTSVGQNGASSAIAKIFIRLCKKEGIKTVNVVRKQEHVQPLLDLGADFVLNSTDPNFDQILKETLEANNVRDFFECVGGDQTSKVLNLLPAQSTVYNYGNLELKKLDGFSSADFIFLGKVLKGWWLTGWIKSLPLNEVYYWANYITQDLLSGSDIFTTTVSKSFPLEDFQQAFEYYVNNMSQGKIIIRPNEN